MKRSAVVRHITLGALATSLVPLTVPGAGAGQHDGSAAGICRSAFGDRGPAEGRVVGEGPSGDSMVVSVGWNPEDWPGGIGRIVTCVSVDGRAVPELAASTVDPPNTGSLMLDLKLPPGEPGSLVCEQNVLVGKGDAPGRTPPTNPECFKLRPTDPPAPTRSDGRTTGDTPAPDRGTDGGSGPSAGHRPAGPPAPAGGGHEGAAAAAGPPAPDDDGRAGAAGPAGPWAPVGPPRSGARVAVDSRAPVGPPASGAGAPSDSRTGRPPGVDPTQPGAASFKAAADRTGTRRAGTTTAPAAPVRTAAAAATAAAAPGADGAAADSAVASDAAGAPDAALARTGIENQIPLAGAGILLALGGAAIMFGEPRRRAWAGRPA